MSDKLLEQVAYVSRKPFILKDLHGNDVEVRDTFPYNPESKTAPDTAMSWALTRSRWELPKFEDPKPEVMILPNAPFKVKITSLEFRSEGGRAYKVIDEQFRRFDLREDQLLEALRDFGIEPGGGIDGTFVWGVSGSQVKMVAVGGKLHSTMIKELEKVKTRTVVSLKDLRVGNIYVKSNGDYELYLGRVAHPDLDGTHHAFTSVYPLFKNDPSILFYDWIDDQRVAVLAPPGMNVYQRSQEYARHVREKQPTHYDHPTSITLTKSPKFFEVIEEENDVQHIIDDENVRFENGNGETISEILHARKHGTRPKDPWMSSRSHYDKWAEERVQAVESTAREFRRQLTWK